MSLAVMGQFLLKIGVNSQSLVPNFQSVVKTLFSPFVFFGFLLYGLSSIIWLFVLQKFPLSVAYPALAVSYILVVFISSMFLKEPLTFFKIGGTLLIICGVFLLFK